MTVEDKPSTVSKGGGRCPRCGSKDVHPGSDDSWICLGCDREYPTGAYCCRHPDCLEWTEGYYCKEHGGRY